MGGGSPIFVTAGGKAYTNGAESDGVALAGGTSGSPAVLDTDVLLQVRVGVEETNGKNGDFRADWQFQYNGGAWTDLTLSSSPVKTTPSQNILNDTNTTNRLGNTPFQAGDYQDDGFSRQHSGINGEFIEFLTTIIIDSGAVTDGFSLNFRVLNGSADPDPTGTNWLYCEVNIPTRTLPGEVANGQSYVNVETIGSRWGPFVDTNGNIYVMSEGGWNQNWDTGKPPIVVHKSADGGKLWTPLGFKEFFDNNGDGDPEGMHIWADPSTTGLWHEFHMETGDDTYRNRWRTSDFSGSPDTWDTANLSEIIQDGADSLNVNLATASGMARQDGDLIAVYPNEALASSLDRLYWRWHNGTAWQDTSPGNVLESNASVEYTQPVMGQGLSSRALVVYKDHTNNDIYLRWATNANPPVWQSRQQLNTNSRTVKNALRAPIVSVVRYDDTNDYHAVIWLDNSDNLWLNTIKWNGSSYDIGATPVQINTVTVESNWPGPTETEDLDNQGPNAGAAADPAEGFVYIMYADATNRDVYRNYWSEGGGVGTETLTVDVSVAHSAGGCTYIAPVVFTHSGGNGGAKVVGFVYELNVGNATPPGRGAYYNEFTPESGGGPQTGTVGIASTTDTALSIVASAGAVLVATGIAATQDTGLTIAPSAVVSVPVGVASTTDTALPVTAVSGALSVPVGIAAETDTALPVVAASSVQVPVGIASTQDTAQTIVASAGLASVAVGISSETDTALPAVASAGAVSVAVGIAQETDTALTITPVQSTNVPVGIATETDTALSIAVASAVSVAVGIASETDTALPITPIQATFVPVGIAQETDSALPIVADSIASVAVGIASETDTALSVVASAGSVSVPVGIASETDTALSVVAGAGAVSVATGIATEQDTALTITPTQAFFVPVGIATETDTALVITAASTVSVPVGIASEQDTALTITPTQATFVPVGIATETDTALSVLASPGIANVPVGIAQETDTALSVISISAVNIAVGIASETNTALSVVASAGATNVAVGIASETDTALSAATVAGSVSVPVGIASEQDTALSIAPVQGTFVPVGIAQETDTALSIVSVAGAASVAVGIASETDTALPIVPQGAAPPQNVPVGISTEQDTALPISPTTSVDVPVGISQEDNFALSIAAVAGTVSVPVSIATEQDTALSIVPSIASFVSVGIAQETDSALAIAPVASNVSVSVGIAATTEIALPIAPFGLSLLPDLWVDVGAMRSAWESGDLGVGKWEIGGLKIR